jgi:hypothetical protein
MELNLLFKIVTYIYAAVGMTQTLDGGDAT